MLCDAVPADHAGDGPRALQKLLGFSGSGAGSPPLAPLLQWPAMSKAAKQDTPALTAEHGHPVAQGVEATLISVDRPIQAAKIAEAIGVEGAKAVTDAIAELNAHYRESGRSFTIEQVAGKAARIEQLPMQPGDVDRTWADLSRSTAELDYAPTTTIADGIAKQWAWLNR